MSERYEQPPMPRVAPASEKAVDLRQQYEALSIDELKQMRISGEAARENFRENSPFLAETLAILEAVNAIITHREQAQSVTHAGNFIQKHLLKPVNDVVEPGFEYTTIIPAAVQAVPLISMLNDSHEDEAIATTCKVVHNGKVVVVNVADFSDDERRKVLARAEEDASSVSTIECFGALAVSSEHDLFERALEKGIDPELLRQEEAEEQARQEAAQQLVTPPAPTQAPAGAEPASIVEPYNANNLIKPGKHEAGRKLRMTKLGAVGLAVTIAVGGGVSAVKMVAMNGDTSTDASKYIDVAQTQQDKDILKDMRPEMTAKDLKLGLCMNEAPLFKGSLDAAAQAVPLYKGVDDKITGVASKNPDGSISAVGMKIEAAPVSVAACAPAELRAAIATMKDGVVTINRKDITPQVLLGAGAATVPDADIPADPARGLSEETATALEQSLEKTETKDDLATLAQVEVAHAIVDKDTPLRMSMLASVDARTISNVKQQIADWYQALNQPVPQMEITFVGEYVAPVVVEPKTIADVKKRTDPSWLVASGKVVKLSFPDVAQEVKK